MSNPKVNAAVAVWLVAGELAGDQSREQQHAAAAAQLALLEAVAGNPLAASALGQMDRIEAVDNAVRGQMANDLVAIGQAEELPDGAPKSVRDLHAVLRPIRLAADAGLGGA